jgi:hypothetical protein
LSNLIKIGIPVIIVLLMLLVIGTGVILARGPETTVTTAPVITAGNQAGNWAGCWYNGTFCPGPCGRGLLNGDNSGSTPPPTTNPSIGSLPSCCRGY